MKPFILFYFLLPILLWCCQTKKETASSVVNIKGNITGVPDGKIYLVESRKWKTPIDSATINNGNFQFRTTISSPFLAAIHYSDSSGIKRLLYRNHTLGNDSLKYATDAFYIEPGNIVIRGDNSKAPFLRIHAGIENELLFQNQFVDFGWIANADSTTRVKKIETIKQTISKNPFSFFLLESIYRNKEQYGKKELTDIFALFDENVRQSKQGVVYQQYLSIRPDDDAPLPNLSLLTENNTSQLIIDTSSKINMLVFWASWCTPCRKEIPLLKTIEQKFGKAGLHMVSISIDENKEQWLKAVAYEKMNWPQVHVPLAQIEEVQNQFRFITIPLIIFTDNKGGEIKRFADYDPDNVDAYKSLIHGYIW